MRLLETAEARLPPTVRLRELAAGAAGHALTVLEPATGRPAAPAIVFLPGRWCNSRLWAVDDPLRDLRVALADAGLASVTASYRCSVEERGPMAPGEIAATRTQDLLEDVGDAVSAAVELSGRPVVLCGFSMGATLGFLAASHPTVQALVALDGGLPAGTDARRPVGGCLANPYLDLRHGRPALARIASGDGTGPAADALRWRLGQDAWWPAAQVEEIRSGRDVLGEELLERVRAVTCPILCVAADDRDPPGDHRSTRTAAATAATLVRTVAVPGTSHEDVATRGPGDDETILREIRRFLDEAL